MKPMNLEDDLHWWRDDRWPSAPLNPISGSWWAAANANNPTGSRPLLNPSLVDEELIGYIERAFSELERED